MARVFISHARADRAPARRLAEALRQAGHTPWIAEDEARIGEPIAETLARGLRDTKAAVVLLSRISVESAWTSTEVSLLRSRASEPLRLHVVRLDRVTPPSEFSEERAIDLFPGETAWQSGVRRLVHVLGEEPSTAPQDELSELSPNNLPPRAVPFVGREEELTALHEHLQSGAANGRVLLSGPRGIGKTTLAVEYAYRHAADYPGGLWWIPAWLGPRRALTWLFKDLAYSDAHSLQADLEPNTEVMAREILRALKAGPKPALLILDDLKGAWQHFLPDGQVHTLVTSRASAFIQLKSFYTRRLRPLSPEDIESMLRVLSPREAPPAVHDSSLARELCERPLLAVLLARLQTHARISWSQLERDVRHRTSTDTGRNARTHSLLLENAVLDVCIERFPSGFPARQILEATALYAPALELDERMAWTSVPGEGLAGLPPEADSALDSLKQSGLVQEGYGFGPPICIPRPVHRRVRELAPPATWEHTCRLALANALIWAQEAKDFGDFDFERLRPHLETVLRASALLSNSRDWIEAAEVLAAYLAEHGEHREAKALRKHTLQRAQREQGHDTELLGHLRSELASAHQALGGISSARRLLERAVADDASTNQGDVAKKAQRLAHLALLQLKLRKPAAALETVDRALKLDTHELAGRDAQLHLRLYLRARILQALERDAEAHEVLEEALATGEQSADNWRAPLVPILEALADSRRERHDEKGALALLERIVDFDHRVLGDEHPETAAHLTRLAQTYSAFQRRPQTLTSVQNALAVLDKALPPSDRRRGGLLLSLAESLLNVDEREQAHRLLQLSLDVEAVQPAPDVAHLFRLMVTSLRWAGQVDDAAPLLERCLSLAQRGSPRPSSKARNLSQLLSQVLNASEPIAHPSAHSSIQTPSPGAGAESLERALRISRRSKVRDELKAEALREALDAAQKGNDPANGARALLLLADLEGRRGAWEQARANARQGLQLALHAEAPPLIAEGYRLLGDAALHGSFYEEARMSYEEAIHRYDQLEEPRRAAQTRALLVSLLMQLGRQDGIEDHLRWLEAHALHSALTEEDRKDVQEVLALASRRLSAPTPDDRHPKS